MKICQWASVFSLVSKDNSTAGILLSGLDLSRVEIDLKILPRAQRENAAKN